jgi:copper chaperone
MSQNTHEFNVPDMTCGHCVSAITKAIKAQDSDAKVAVTLAEKRVVVETSDSREEIAACLSEAGYTAA